MTPDGLAGLAGHSELPPPPPGMTTHERLSQLLETEMQHGHLLQALPPLRPQHNVSALLGSSLSASPTTPTHQHTDTPTHRHTDTRHTDTPTHRHTDCCQVVGALRAQLRRLGSMPCA